MSLKSPRFFTSKKLINAASGIPIRMGANGRAVHLVQMALIDLGYPMPKSTGNIKYSPDGIFGNETREKLKAFQNDNNIPQTGIIDRDTILALDHLLPDYKHRVRLHFRSISLTNVPFSNLLSSTEVVYAQYGIKVEFASGQSLLLSDAEQQTFLQIDDECNWEITAGEFHQLHNMGTPAPSTDVLVFYVQEFKEGISGCGGHTTNRPACTVASIGNRWTTAHEIGHVLLTSSYDPVHIGDPRNLMYGTTKNPKMMPVLTDMQVTKIRQSVCCVAI